jgi:hypothetical protein
LAALLATVWEAVVATVKVVFPEVVTSGAAQVASLGKPEQLKLTVPEKPLLAPTVRARVPDCPGLGITKVLPDSLSEKSGRRFTVKGDELDPR